MCAHPGCAFALHTHTVLWWCQLVAQSIPLLQQPYNDSAPAAPEGDLLSRSCVAELRNLLEHSYEPTPRILVQVCTCTCVCVYTVCALVRVCACACLHVCMCVHAYPHVPSHTCMQSGVQKLELHLFSVLVFCTWSCQRPSTTHHEFLLCNYPGTGRCGRWRTAGRCMMSWFRWCRPLKAHVQAAGCKLTPGQEVAPRGHA